ncbi:hypothetical protein ACWGJT_30145 [Streptomyces xantholiticus]
MGEQQPKVLRPFGETPDIAVAVQQIVDELAQDVRAQLSGALADHLLAAAEQAVDAFAEGHERAKTGKGPSLGIQVSQTVDGGNVYEITADGTDAAHCMTITEVPEPLVNYYRTVHLAVSVEDRAC